MGTTRASSSAAAIAIAIAIASTSTSSWSCFAWRGSLPTISTRNRRWGGRSTPLLLRVTDVSSSTDAAASGSAVPEGVEEFEEWFSGIEGSSCNPYIRHDSFGGGALRGLGTRDRSVVSGGDGGEPWMRIPRSVTLSSDFREPDWDASLAESLWREVLRGPESPVRGYVSLLTRSWTPKDLPAVPPYPAPDALRHWTEAQREALAVHPEGRALLDLQRRQEASWRAKHDAIRSSSSSSSSSMTWEQFEWAMEAVHSRAFRGDFGIVGGGGRLPAAANLGAPAVAALASWVYFAPMHGQSDAVLLGLAVLGALPSAINLLRESPPVAVLLPLIDSANHLESADSSISYSPLSDSFELTGGPGCLVPEADGKQQLYISYGSKSDKELLLNYGFLKDDGGRASESIAENEDAETERRRKLAEVFVGNR